MDDSYIIYHFVEKSGEGEILVIQEKAVEAPATPTGFKLYMKYAAEIESGSTLPLERNLYREGTRQR